MTRTISDIAVPRSGDKGGNANIGVIALAPEHWPTIRRLLTADRVAAFLAGSMTPPEQRWEVERYELPNLHALNFVVHGILADGDPLGGGSTSLRADAQGKTLGQMLLTMPLENANV